MEKQPTSIELSITPEWKVVQTQQAKILVMGSLRAPSYEEEKRAPVDIITVIDRSGSMSSKVKLVKMTLEFMIKQLKKIDSLAIVIYDDSVDILLPLTHMDPQGKEKAHNALDKINPRGGTNLCSGLIKGLDLIRERGERKDQVSSVLLFTDGLANVGYQKLNQIISMMKGIPVSGEDIVLNPEDIKPIENFPCTVHTFGFGSDHDPILLKGISDAGKGIYFYVKDEDGIADCFSDCLGGLLTVVAQNLFVDFKSLGGTKIEKVNTKFALTVLEQNIHHQVKLPDLQSEEERDLLVEVSLPESGEQESVEIIEVILSYYNVISCKQENFTQKLIIKRGPQNEIPNPTLDKQRNRILAADAILESQSKAQSGQMENARTIITDAITKIKSSVSFEDPFCQSLIEDLNQVLNGLKDRQTYYTSGSKQMTGICHSHYQQRSNKTTTSYMTAMRYKMQSNTQEKP